MPTESLRERLAKQALEPLQEVTAFPSGVSKTLKKDKVT